MGHKTSPLDSFLAIWEDQAEFNAKLRSLPQSFEARSLLTKDLVLHLISEADELLRTSIWKSHRRLKVQPNMPATLQELVDIFKCWLTLVQGWGYSPEEFFAAYWSKSMVVRQRHSEEWTSTLKPPIAVIDIDNTICDYTSGLIDWLITFYPELTHQLTTLQKTRGWINASSLKLSEMEWQQTKHRFRTSGAKVHLALMPSAKEFLAQLHTWGYHIVLLTSRPIDRYPNIYTDTLQWLHGHGLVFDRVWWSHDKVERLSDIAPYVTFMVDDDPKFAQAASASGIRTFWLDSMNSGASFDSTVIRVSSLMKVLDFVQYYDTTLR